MERQIDNPKPPTGLRGVEGLEDLLVICRIDAWP
jgi:hypothetical protein